MTEVYTEPPAVATANIPRKFTRRPQWVNWRYEQKPGKVKIDKVPYTPGTTPGTDRRASTTDLMTWGTFKEAVEGYEAGRYDGIGFVFCSGDPYAGVDLDDCRNPETGELEEWAEEIVASFGKGSYVEASPSGTGVHIIVRGKAPNKKVGKVEAYSSERFFTMTGQVIR